MPLFADTFALPFPKSTFGNRFGIHDIVDGHDLYGAQGHRGTDFIVGANTPVPATANGEVEHVLHSVGLGNVVVLRHYLHGAANDVYSFACHLNASRVREGQTVNRGSIIALSGNTGTQSHGNHLHLAMSHDDMGGINGEVFDPIAFIEQFTPVGTVKFTPKFTLAKRGEGLIAIASRSRITFRRIQQLNPKITGPEYVVQLGQKVRIA